MTKQFSCPFKDVSICENIPTVEYKPEWYRGGIGYLDGVRPTDEIFNAGPLAKFIDTANRSAIAIKYNIVCLDGYEKHNDEYSVVAFQRYTNNYDTWVFGGHFAHSITSAGLFDHSWLENLIVNKSEKFDPQWFDCPLGVLIAESEFDKFKLKGCGNADTIECSVNLVGENSLEGVQNDNNDEL
jgi:hypothetical protein